MRLSFPAAQRTCTGHSGGLTEKLRACAAAGFGGVEIVDSDLTVAEESPEEIRALCQRLGLRIDMFQPFRDVEGVSEDVFAATLRRAGETFRTMNRLGTDLLLVCSNAGTATIDDDELAAEQLGRLADAPQLDMDLLSWSRHHRLFPGEGDFNLTEFLSHVLRAGYRGPLSLEVFNDTVGHIDVYRTASHAQRSLTSLARTQPGR